jgi:hypothetical protein
MALTMPSAKKKKLRKKVRSIAQVRPKIMK